MKTATEIMAEERTAIESLSVAYPNYGAYALARRIVDKDFPQEFRTTHSLVNQATSHGRAFYSILSVIRRHRAARVPNHVMA